MRLEPLLAFCAVVEHGSFSKAGEALQLSQPAISMSMKQLEQEYGQPLLTKKNKTTIVLTPLGEKLFELAMELKSIKESIEQLKHQSLLNTHKMINIQSDVTVGAYILSQGIMQFQEEHPEIQISIKKTSTIEALDNLVQGKIDFVMLFSPEFTRHLQPIKNWRDEIILVVSPQHPFSQNPPELHQLAAEPYIMAPQEYPTRKIVTKAFKEKLGVEPSCALELGNPEITKKAVRSMNKPTFILKSIVREELYNGQLSQVETGFDLRCQHVLFHRKNQHISETLRTFLDFLQPEMSAVYH